MAPSYHGLKGRSTRSSGAVGALSSNHVQAGRQAGAVGGRCRAPGAVRKARPTAGIGLSVPRLAAARAEFEPKAPDDHRCYAFGEPEPLSGEQQRNVCLQLGYANCPRYLRGCWSFRPMSSRLCAALRRRFRRRLLPTDGRPRSGSGKPQASGRGPPRRPPPRRRRCRSLVAAGRTLARWRSGHHQPPSWSTGSTGPRPRRPCHRPRRALWARSDIHHWSVELQPDRSRDAHRRCPADDTERVQRGLRGLVPDARAGGGRFHGRLHGDVQRGVGERWGRDRGGADGRSRGRRVHGGELGFGGLAGSLAVEFDTFFNTWPGVSDPNPNHVSVQTPAMA